MICKNTQEIFVATHSGLCVDFVLYVKKQLDVPHLIVPTFVPTFIFDHRNTVFLSTRNASKTPVISMKFRLPPRLYVVQIPLPQPSSRTKKDIYAKNPEVSTVSPHRYTMCHRGTAGTGKSKTQAHAFEFASCFLHKDRA